MTHIAVRIRQNLNVILAILVLLFLTVVVGALIPQKTAIPQYIIVIALLFPFGIWVLKNPYLGFLVFIFLMMLSEVQTPIPGVSYSRLMGPILLIVYLINGGGKLSESKVKDIPLSLRAIIIWLLLGGISLVWSIRPDVTINRLVSSFQLLVLMLLVIGFLNNQKRIRQALLTIGFGAIVSAVIGFVTFFSGNDYIVMTERVSTGDMQGANRFATVVGMGVTIFFAFLLFGRGKHKWAYLLAAVLCFAGVFTSGSRGGLVSLLIVSTVYVLGYGKSIPKLLSSILLLIALVSIVWFVGNETGLLTDVVLTRLSPDVVTERGVVGRTLIWKAFLSYIFPQSPLLGYGYSTAPYTIALDQRAVLLSRGTFWDTHNSFLHILIDLGILGLSLWLFAIINILHRLVKVYKISTLTGGADIFWASVGLFVQLLIHDQTLTIIWTKQVWFTLGLAIAVPKIFGLMSTNQNKKVILK